jgi:hypothetical protein
MRMGTMSKIYHGMQLHKIPDVRLDGYIRTMIKNLEKRKDKNLKKARY